MYIWLGRTSIIELVRDLRVMNVLATFENYPTKIADLGMLTGLVCPVARPPAQKRKGAKLSQSICKISVVLHAKHILQLINIREIIWLCQTLPVDWVVSHRSCLFTRARFMSLARSKLRLCSANHWLIGQAQPELTPNRRQKIGPGKASDSGGGRQSCSETFQAAGGKRCLC